MKKIIFVLPVLCLTLFAFTSIERATYDATQGFIQAIGNAGSDEVLTFKKWRFLKSEMPNNKVENVQIELEINISSMQADWKDLEKGLKKKKDYFYLKKFPKAIVKIDGATAIEAGKYQTEAMLTLKGITERVPLTFTVSEVAPYQVKGEGIVLRRTFGFDGDGPKDEVPISFEVTLP